MVLFLPAHDEEATVAAVVTRVPARVAGRRVECLVVDDGSGDRTAEQAAAAGATVLSVPANRGLGAAVRLGLAAAVARGAAWSPSATPTASTTRPSWSGWSPPSWKGRADYVVGSRYAGEIRRMLPQRRLGNLALTTLLRFVARAPIGDGFERVPGLSRAAAADAEDRPRLQLRPGAHPRPAGQGAAAVADRLPVPHLWPLLRPPPALPAPGRRRCGSKPARRRQVD